MTGVQTCALPICFPVTIGGFSKLSGVRGFSNGGIPGFVDGDKTPEDVLKNMGSQAERGGFDRVIDLVRKQGYVEYGKKQAAKAHRNNYVGWLEEVTDSGKIRFIPPSDLDITKDKDELWNDYIGRKHQNAQNEQLKKREKIVNDDRVNKGTVDSKYGLEGILQRQPDWKTTKSGRVKKEYSVLGEHYNDVLDIIEKTIGDVTKNTAFSGSKDELVGGLKSQVVKGSGLTNKISELIGDVFSNLDVGNANFSQLTNGVFGNQKILERIISNGLDPNKVFTDIYGKIGNVYGIERENWSICRAD